MSYLHLTSLNINHKLCSSFLLPPLTSYIHILPFLFFLFFLSALVNAFTPPLHSRGCFIHQSQYSSTTPQHLSSLRPTSHPISPPSPPQHMVHPWRPVHSQLLPSPPTSCLASVALALAHSLCHSLFSPCTTPQEVVPPRAPLILSSGTCNVEN